MITSSPQEAIPEKEMKRIARRQISIILIVFALMALSNTYQAFTRQTWQAWTIAGVAIARLLFLMTGLYLVRRNRRKQGVLLVVATLLITFQPISILLPDLSWWLAMLMIVAVLLVASGTLAKSTRNRVLLLTLLVAALTGLSGLFPFPFRAFVPGLQLVAAIATSVILLVLFYFVVRGYGNYPLGVKLAAAFLVIIVVAVGLISSFANTTIRNSLTQEIGSNLAGIASTQAAATSNLLATQLDVLQSFTLNSAVRERLAQANDAYGEGAGIGVELSIAKQRWASAEEDDPFVQARLSNLAGLELDDFLAGFPQFKDVLLTDIHGGLLTASRRFEQYAYADETWWQSAFNGGQGATLIGNPEVAEDGEVILPIVVPILVENQAVGILRANYKLDALAQLAAASRVGETGHGEIYLSDGYQLDLEDGEFFIEEAEIAYDDVTAQLATDLPFIQTIYDETDSLVTFSKTGSDAADPAINELGWVLVYHQTADEALASVEVQQQRTNLLTIVAAIFAAVVGYALSQLLISPVRILTRATDKVAAGDLATRAAVSTGDEMQTLATAFNEMTSRLQATLTDLQQRNVTIETSNEISRRLTASLDPEQLMREIVTQLQDAFHFYHVHMYMFDAAQRELVMVAGTGAAGQKMLAQKHAIPKGRGVVGRAAERNTPMLVRDVFQDPSWLPNALLPETRAEVAIPIAVGSQVMGVLDVQHHLVGVLDQENISMLQSIANQVAIALQNARQYQQTQASEARTRIVLESVTVPLLISRLSDGRLYYANNYLAEMLQLPLDQLLAGKMPDFYAQPADRQFVATQIEQQQALSNYELRLQRADGEPFWALMSAQPIEFEGEPAIFTTLLDITERKLAQNVIAKQAADLQAVAELNTVAMSIPNTSTMLPLISNQIKERFGLYHTHIFLLDGDEGVLRLAAGAGDIGKQMVEEGYQIALGHEQSIVARAARTAEPVLVNDVANYRDHMPNPRLPLTRAELTVPLLAGKTVLGVLDVQTDTADSFSQSDVNILTTLASQLAASIKSAQAIEEAETAVSQLNKVMQRLTREGWQSFLRVNPDARLSFGFNQQEVTAVAPGADEDITAGATLMKFLEVQGEEIGVLALAEPKHLTSEAREIVTAVADRLSNHIENLRLAQQTEAALARTDTLYRVGRSLLSSEFLPDLLQRTAENIAGALGADRTMLVLCDVEKQEVTHLFGAGPGDADVELSLTFTQAWDGLSGWAMRERQPVLSPQGQPDPRESESAYLHRVDSGLGAIIVTPLIYQDRVLGTITAINQAEQPDFGQEDVELMMALTTQAAAAINNRLLAEQIENRARQEQTLREITARIYAAPDAESILRTTAQEVNRVLGIDAFVYLEPENNGDQVETNGNSQNGRR